MKELDDYLDAVSKRKPRHVGSGQVNVAALMVLEQDDVPRLIRLLQMAVGQLESQLENCTSEGQAAGLETCFFDMGRLLKGGCVGRIGGHVPSGWYRSRPKAVQAFQWVGSETDFPEWARGKVTMSEDHLTLIIPSATGGISLSVNRGEWLTRSPEGVIYVAPAEQFLGDFEPA